MNLNGHYTQIYGLTDEDIADIMDRELEEYVDDEPENASEEPQGRAFESFPVKAFAFYGRMVAKEFIAKMNPETSFDALMSRLEEEVEELLSALLDFASGHTDATDVLKELIDCYYVIFQFAVVFEDENSMNPGQKWMLGLTSRIIDVAAESAFDIIQPEKDTLFLALDRVHTSNLTKLHNGKPLKGPGGKIMKGPNYVDPDLSDLV